MGRLMKGRLAFCCYSNLDGLGGATYAANTLRGLPRSSRGSPSPAYYGEYLRPSLPFVRLLTVGVLPRFRKLGNTCLTDHRDFLDTTSVRGMPLSDFSVLPVKLGSTAEGLKA